MNMQSGKSSFWVGALKNYYVIVH